MTSEYLKEIFSYENGNLIWKENRSRYAKKGYIAGSLTNRGYIQIKLNGISYLAHRLIYLYHNSNFNIKFEFNKEIDHINGNRADNRIENLRIVTKQQNQWNQTKAKGYKKRQNGKYNARIRANGKLIELGEFASAEEAHRAYLDAKKQIHKI